MDRDPASKPKSKIDRRSERRNSPKPPIAVEVSHDGRTWKPGHILNTSKSGAMIETSLHRNYGEKIHVKTPKEGTRCIASGSVAHILVGEKNEQIGMGVIFNRSAEWAALCKHLAAADTRQPTKPVKSDVFPIHVEISRDGALWIDAQIASCDAARAHIKTIMLAKPEETMRVRFQKQEIPTIVIGRIKQVGLERVELLAEIELDFDPKSGWPEVYAQLLARTSPGPRDAEKIEPDRKRPEKKIAKDEDWSKAVLANKEDEEKPSDPGQKTPPQNPSIINKRFYQSLIGRKMDNYEVVSFISSGAMGGVFKGWDTALERDVALKVISWELSSQEEFVEMFFKEARVISKLNHPNISQIYHFGNTNDIIYYAMEFVHGQNMLELNKKNVRFHPSQIVNYLKTICYTLDYVWKNNIIHRDIKPANIMLTKDDQLKVVDFGVAQIEKVGKKQSDTKIVGSPLYLSPETICNQEIDLRSDIYSLGATFFHLIAGTPPFIDISLRKILQKHLHDPIPSLKSKNPETPDYLCHIIEKMMAKDASERFQDYGEIIKRLDNAPRKKKARLRLF